MSYTLVFHPKAYQEYQEAWLWYEAISAELGERFVMHSGLSFRRNLLIPQ
jgi:hypothetical protein